jgi:hypothetical protein
MANPACNVDERFALARKEAHFIGQEDQYYKTENPDTGLKTGYTLKPRQDLCVVRFTEYCKRNGMLLIHNVGSGKTITAAELVVNMFPWLTETDMQARPELLQVNAQIEEKNAELVLAQEGLATEIAAVTQRALSAVNADTRMRHLNSIPDIIANNRDIPRLTQELSDLAAQKAVLLGESRRDVLVITPTAMYSQFNEDIEKNIPGIHRVSETGCPDSVYTYKREVQNANGTKNYQTSPSFTIKSMEYRQFNPIHAKYDEKIRDLKLIFKDKIVVFDEAHRLFKPFNPCDPNSSIIEKYIIDNVLVEAKNVIFMTGTPLKNNVRDMFNMLRILTLPKGNSINFQESEGFNLNNMRTYQKFIPTHKLVFDLAGGIQVTKTRVRAGWYLSNLFKFNFTNLHPDYCNLTTTFIAQRKLAGFRQLLIGCYNFFSIGRLKELFGNRKANINVAQFRTFNNDNVVGGNSRKNKKNKNNRTKKLIGGMTLKDSYIKLNITNEIPEAAENKKVEPNTESFNIIKTRYHELARKIHPDKNPSSTSNQEFIALKEAYETITGEIPETVDPSLFNEFPELQDVLLLYYGNLFNINDGREILKLTKKYAKIIEAKEFEKAIDIIGYEHLITELFTTPPDIYIKYLEESFDLQENDDTSLILDNMKAVLNETNIENFKKDVKNEQDESVSVLNKLSKDETSETSASEKAVSGESETSASEKAVDEEKFNIEGFDKDTDDIENDEPNVDTQEEQVPNLSDDNEELDIETIYSNLTPDKKEEFKKILKGLISEDDLKQIEALQKEIDDLQSSNGGEGPMRGGMKFGQLLTGALAILSSLSGIATGARTDTGTGLIPANTQINVPQPFDVVNPFIINISNAANATDDKPIYQILADNELSANEYKYVYARNSTQIVGEDLNENYNMSDALVPSDSLFNGTPINPEQYYGLMVTNGTTQATNANDGPAPNSTLTVDLIEVKNEEVTIFQKSMDIMKTTFTKISTAVESLKGLLDKKLLEILEGLTKIVEGLKEKIGDVLSNITIFNVIALPFKAIWLILTTIITKNNFLIVSLTYTSYKLMCYTWYLGNEFYNSHGHPGSVLRNEVSRIYAKAYKWCGVFNKRLMPGFTDKMKYAKKIGCSRFTAIMNKQLAERNAFGSINIDEFVKQSQKIISTISTDMPQINEFYYNGVKNTNLYTVKRMYEENLLTIEDENRKYPKRVIKNNYIFYSPYQVFLYNQNVFIKKFTNNRKDMQITNDILPWFFNRPELLQKKFIGNCSYDIAYSQTELKDGTKSIVYFDPSEADYVLNINRNKVRPAIGVGREFNNNPLKQLDPELINFECSKFDRILINLLLMKTGNMIHETTDKDVPSETSIYNQSGISLDGLRSYPITIKPQAHFSRGKHDPFDTENQANMRIYKDVSENKAHEIPPANPHNFLPFVYSCSDDLGLNLFAWYLKKKGFKYTNLHDIHPNYDNQRDKSLKQTYPILTIDDDEFRKKELDTWIINNVIKYSENNIDTVITNFKAVFAPAEIKRVLLDEPICILLHPFKTEGVDGKYNPAIFLMEPPLNFCDYEQLCGRVLRSYTRPYTEKPTKMVYQMLTTSAEGLDNFMKDNIGRENGINSILPEEQYFLKDYFATEKETPKQAGIFWSSKAKGIRLVDIDEPGVQPGNSLPITRESIHIPLYVPDYSLSVGYYDQLTATCKNMVRATATFVFPDVIIPELRTYLYFLYQEFGDLTAYSDLNDCLLNDFRAKLQTALELYRISGTIFADLHEKVSQQEVKITYFDYIRDDYSVTVRALEKFYYANIYYKYVMYSIDFIYSFYQASFVVKSGLRKIDDPKSRFIEGEFNASYLIKFMEYLEAIPNGVSSYSYEVNLKANLTSMKFEIDEMKEIKSTEYDFNKIIQKLSGLEPINPELYEPPVTMVNPPPSLRRIPDLDLILDCVGKEDNSDAYLNNYFTTSLCDPLTDIRNRTCFSLSRNLLPPELPIQPPNRGQRAGRPQTPEEVQAITTYKQGCDQYIEQLKVFYGRYEDIINRPAPLPADKIRKKQDIIDLYTEINAARQGIYATIVPVVAAPQGNANPNGNANANANPNAAQAQPSRVSQRQPPERKTPFSVEFSEPGSNPRKPADTASSSPRKTSHLKPAGAAASSSRKTGSMELDDPRLYNSDNDSEYEYNAEDSDKNSDDGAGNSDEEEEYVGDTSPVWQNSLANPRALVNDRPDWDDNYKPTSNTPAANSNSNNDTDSFVGLGGSLKNNKKKKTIKMNLRRGLKKTIKKR